MKRKLNSVGASLIEYGILAGVVSTVAIGSVLAVGDRTNFVYRVVDQALYQAMNEGENYLSNGDFDDVSGGISHSWGFSHSELSGWVSNNGLPFELHASGWGGMSSVNGDYWLDMGASPGAMDITQTLDDLIPDAIYQITLFAGDRSATLNNATEIYWNGSRVGVLTANTRNVMQEFTYYVEAQDGPNALRLVEVGGTDSEGMSLDYVRIWGR